MNIDAYAKCADQILLSCMYLIHGYVTCCTNVLKSFAHEELDYE